MCGFFPIAKMKGHAALSLVQRSLDLNVDSGGGVHTGVNGSVVCVRMLTYPVIL